MQVIEANNIRKRNILKYDGKLWLVLKIMHTQPGKGGAYIQVEVKNIINKTKNNYRFRSDEHIERVSLEQKLYQFLYKEGKILILMDKETYEQVAIDEEIAGEQSKFLQDNMEVSIDFYQNQPMKLSLSETIISTISECEPVIKGQTATASYKPAILENGVRIMVPPFIEVGERVVIKTEDIEYLERAK